MPSEQWIIERAAKATEAVQDIRPTVMTILVGEIAEAMRDAIAAERERQAIGKNREQTDE